MKKIIAVPRKNFFELFSFSISSGNFQLASFLFKQIKNITLSTDQLTQCYTTLLDTNLESKKRTKFFNHFTKYFINTILKEENPTNIIMSIIYVNKRTYEKELNILVEEFVNRKEITTTNLLNIISSRSTKCRGLSFLTIIAKGIADRIPTPTELFKSFDLLNQTHNRNSSMQLHAKSVDFLEAAFSILMTEAKPQLENFQIDQLIKLIKIFEYFPKLQVEIVKELETRIIIPKEIEGHILQIPDSLKDLLPELNKLNYAPSTQALKILKTLSAIDNISAEDFLKFFEENKAIHFKALNFVIDEFLFRNEFTNEQLVKAIVLNPNCYILYRALSMRQDVTYAQLELLFTQLNSIKDNLLFEMNTPQSLAVIRAAQFLLLEPPKEITNNQRFLLNVLKSMLASNSQYTKNLFTQTNIAHPNTPLTDSQIQHTQKVIEQLLSQ